MDQGAASISREYAGLYSFKGVRIGQFENKDIGGVRAFFSNLIRKSTKDRVKPLKLVVVLMENHMEL